MAALRNALTDWEIRRYRSAHRRYRILEPRHARVESTRRRPGAQGERYRQPDKYGVERYRQPDKYGVDARRGVPRLWYAGRLHDARGWLLPIARDRQRADGVYRRHVSLRPPLLRVRLRLHVQPRERTDRLP